MTLIRDKLLTVDEIVDCTLELISSSNNNNLLKSKQNS